MNMKRTFLGEVMPKRTESVLCAIIAFAVTGLVTADNCPDDMRLEPDWDSACYTRTNTSIANGVVFVRNSFKEVPNVSSGVDLSTTVHLEDTACIKSLVELDAPRMKRIHARLALAAMEFAIRSDQEGEFIGILADFLAKGLKEEGAK